MKKFLMSLLGALALIGLAVSAAAAQSAAVTIHLNEVQGSGDVGTATLTTVGPNQTRVVLQMGGAMPMEHNHPAHIHQGTCATLDPTPAFALNPVTNGHSDTTVPVALTTLLARRYAINLHESPAAITTYTACGELTTLNAVRTPPGAAGLPPTGKGPELLWGSALLAGLLLTSLGLRLVRGRAA